MIFVYLAPFVVALGIHWFIPNESLSRIQVIGMVLAFSGILVAFGEGFTVLTGKEWIGDLACVFTAIFWGATTVLVRATRLANIAPSRTLHYQLLVSVFILLPAAWLFGEAGISQLSPLIIACLLFQGLLVAFASYLTWFWLIAHYPAAKLSA